MSSMTSHQSRCRKYFSLMSIWILNLRAKQMEKQEVWLQGEQNRIEGVAQRGLGMSVWKVMVMVGMLVLAFAVPKVSAAVVPNVVGQELSTAEELIEDVGFIFSVAGQEASIVVPVGHVISQSPIANTNAPDGSLVTVIVSSGPITSRSTSTVMSPTSGWSTTR